MLIRACEAGDLQQITAIYDRAVRTGSASFEIDPPGEIEMAERRQALLDGGYPYLVAELEGEVAGYAYAGPYRARPAYRSTVENSVYIAERYQRRGLGRGLLASVIEAAAESGFRQMIAVIGDSANLPSVRLHETAGFVHVGTLRAVGWKHGRWLDTVLMQRPLGEGSFAPSELVPPG